MRRLRLQTFGVRGITGIDVGLGTVMYSAVAWRKIWKYKKMDRNTLHDVMNVKILIYSSTVQHALY